jgi:hypothetical protein
MVHFKDNDCRKVGHSWELYSAGRYCTRCTLFERGSFPVN